MDPVGWAGSVGSVVAERPLERRPMNAHVVVEAHWAAAEGRGQSTRSGGRSRRSRDSRRRGARAGPSVDVLVALRCAEGEVAQLVRRNVDAAREQAVTLQGSERPVVADEVRDRVAHIASPLGGRRATAYAANPCASRRRRGERLQARAATCPSMYVHALSNEVQECPEPPRCSSAPRSP